MKNSLPILLLLFVLITSCSKQASEPDNNDHKSNLGIIVTDFNKIPVVGATVNLYLTQMDYDSDKNVFISAKTDSTGLAFFPGKNTQGYFLRIFKTDGCWSSMFSEFYFFSGVGPDGYSSNFPITIHQIGTVNFKNNSPYPYDIFINGNLFYTLDLGYSVSTVQKADDLIFELKQARGFTTNPIDQKFTKTLAPCTNLIINMP